MQTIENEFFKVSVDEVGALLTSVIDKKTGQELLWQKDPAFWQNQDVVIFPVIGAPEYDVAGKHYVCQTRHGFARTQKFTVETKTADSLTLKLTANEETRKVYPFEFELFASVSLTKNVLLRDIKVVNKGTTPLPFALGLHQAFKAKFDGTASIRLSKKPSLYYPMREGLFKAPEKSIYKQKEILRKDLWAVNETWSLPNQGFDIDVQTGYGYSLAYRFEAPQIAIWSKQSGGD